MKLQTITSSCEWKWCKLSTKRFQVWQTILLQSWTIPKIVFQVLWLHQSRENFLLLQRICTIPTFPMAQCSSTLCKLLGKLITCSKTFCQKAQPWICQLLSIPRRTVFFCGECPVLWRTSFFRLQGFCAFDCGSTWIHLFLATPKYFMALAQATGTQPSLTMTSFFVFLPMWPMHCFSELMEHIVIGNISGWSWFALIDNYSQVPYILNVQRNKQASVGISQGLEPGWN